MGFLLWATAILVAVARVYVGLHHATDMIGSIVISSVAVALTYAVFRYRHKAIA